MPELPDVTVYVERLCATVGGQRLETIRLASPFLLRSVDPPLDAFDGRVLLAVERLGKRLVFAFEGELFLVLHLMIAGRLRWRPDGAELGQRAALAGFDFENGTLVLTEAGTKRRASLHTASSRADLAPHDRGGLEVLDANLDAFAGALRKKSHTLKRALCDARLFSGIGNAYSDEILHRARLSPMARTGSISDEELARLFDATRDVLREWTDRLRDEVGDGFPEKVTAFREGMAVHGRHGEPCPDCGAPVQRIVYSSRETNYCARCQTGGKLLADRALSRLLKDDWPKRIEELE